MIITKKYAVGLVRAGKAEFDGSVLTDLKKYMILTRFDKQRADHFEIADNNEKYRLMSKFPPRWSINMDEKEQHMRIIEC